MSYNAIIVDDEQMILNSMISIIDWEKFGFKVVGLFKDGKEAIDYIENNPVDVVFTDIKMPIMDGPELIRRVREFNSKIKLVLISGVQDFETARNAIEYNVVRYLLKPTRYSELVATIEAVKEVLDKDKVNNNVNDEALPLITKQIFFDLFTGAVTDEAKIKNNFKMAGIDEKFVYNPCCVSVFKILDFNKYINEIWQHGFDRFSTAVYQIFMENNVDINFYVFEQVDDSFKVIAVSKDKISIDKMKELVTKFIDETSKNILEILNAKIQLSNIIYYDKILDLPQNANNDKENSLNKENSELLANYINSGDIDAVNNLVVNYFRTKTGQDINNVLEFNKFLVDTLYLNAQNLEALKKANINNILRGEDYSEICERTKYTLISLTGFISESISYSGNIIAVKVKTYVNEHYAEDITLEGIAKHLLLTPTYISKLFKEQTGENFIDYLISVRVEKAKELLKNTDIKVYEISEKVGYNSLKYFYKIFKKYTDCSPSEFRNKYQRY